MSTQVWSWQNISSFIDPALMCFYILVILELYVLPESEYILSQIKGRQNIANPLIKRELATF